MDCARVRGCFDDAYFSLLSESESEEFFAHLKECVNCAEGYERLKSAWEKLKEAGKVSEMRIPSLDSVLARLRRKPLFIRKWFLVLPACYFLLSFTHRILKES
ncbi:MAG: hypothetical protein N2234_01900 [Planctomycetota bacterium]|nr:hypothetical protein [Planctomycetota bacterium]